MKLARYFLVVLLASYSVAASENNIPVPFRGHDDNSPIEIDYSDWNIILKNTVIGAKSSARARGKKLHSIKAAPTGSRIARGNKRDTRNDGNRIDLKTLSKDVNIEDLTKIRKSLEAVPAEAPMNLWSKNEQLAYWLNLYNITIIEQFAEKYPFRKLNKLKKTKKNNIWDQKLLNVAGVNLSLNDIQYTILPNKWDNKLFIYGLYQGYISGPSIQRSAFTGRNVNDLLTRSAREFVNSNRGMKYKRNTLRVASFYKENEALFPNWEEDLKAHILNLSHRNVQSEVSNTSKIKLLKVDYHTTDVYAGGSDPGTAYSNNMAALEFATVGAADTFGASGEGGMSSVDGHTSILDLMRDITAREVEKRRLPAATREYILEMRKDELRRKGDVRIEDVSEDNNTENSNN